MANVREEHVFLSTFIGQSRRVLKIQTTHFNTHDDENVEPSAGFYDFSDAPSSLTNRFIIWRALGSDLFLDERSVEKSLQNASVCLNFSPVEIVNETKICFADGKLLIFVPTHNVLHRFVYDITAFIDRTDFKERSVLTLFTEETLLQCHDIHVLLSPKSLERSSIVHTGCKGSHTLYCLADGTILLIEMPETVANNIEGHEKVLRGDNLLHRFFKTLEKSIATSVQSILIRDETLFYVLLDDNHLHVYSLSKRLCDVDLIEAMSHELMCEIGVEVTASSMKIFSNKHYQYIVFHMQVDISALFVIAEIPFLPDEDDIYLKLIDTIRIECVDLIDFQCFVNDDALQIMYLYRPWDDNRYVVRSVFRNCLNGEVSKQCDLSDLFTHDAFILRQAKTISTKDKRCEILDCNNYPFDIVQRSIQLVCKQNDRNCEIAVEYGDWNSLNDIIDQYFASTEFVQYYINPANRSILMGTGGSEVGQERFWSELSKICNELLQNECHPIALWRSTPLSLHGIIEQSCFTVHENCDIDNLLFSQFNDDISDNVEYCWCKAGEVAANGTIFSSISSREEDKFIAAFAPVSHVFENIISKFADLKPIDEPKLTDDVSNTSTYGGQFAAGLAGASLRSTVDLRLACSQRLIALVKLVESASWQPDDGRWKATVATYEELLQDLNCNYTILSQAASIKVPSNAKCEISLVDAFFIDGGFGIIHGYSLNEEKYGDEDLEAELNNGKDVMDGADNMDEEEEIDEGEYEMDDEISAFGDEINFSKFIKDIVNNAVAVLWPRNHALILPKYLAVRSHYAALLEYCNLNKPYVAELSCAYRYFEGVACAGLRDPEKALQLFLEAMQGIRNGDQILFNVLNDGEKHKERRRITEASYVLKVMTIFELHGFCEQLIDLGKFVLRVARREPGGDVNLLPSIYVVLFKNELAIGRYEDALKSLLGNPVSLTRSACLRELVFRLYDERKIRTLVNLSYQNMENEVVEQLEAHAHLVDINADTCCFEILYSFHFRRSNFVKAAQTMLDYAARLENELQDRDTLAKRSQALATACQTLSLLPTEDQFLILPKTDEEECEDSEDMSTEIFGIAVPPMKKKPIQILTLDELNKRAMITCERLAILDASSETSKLQFVPPPSLAEDIYKKLISLKLYDRAWTFGRVFDFPPYPIIVDVLKSCMISQMATHKTAPVWTLRNRAYERYSFGIRDFHWYLARSYIEQAVEDRPNDLEVLWTATRIFLEYQYPIPHWLSSLHEERCISGYTRLLMMFNRLDLACFTLDKFVVREMSRLTSSKIESCLPILEIEWLYYLCQKADNATLNEPLKVLTKHLKEYTNRRESLSRW